jgi:pseudouridine-5'-monophosphatase
LGLRKVKMAKLWPHRIRAVIFDLDGTLVDSEGAYTLAQEECTGQKLDLNFKVAMMGSRYLDACALTVAHYNLPETPQEFADRYARVVQKYWKTIGLLPGVFPLLEALAARGVKMCIGTSSEADSYEEKVANHQKMVGYMDHVVTGNMVKEGKPAPELFLLALNKWDNILPEEALVFEDSPLGIEAANRAGMPAVFVPDHLMAEHGVFKDMTAKPILTIPSLEAFNLDLLDWGNV